MTIQFRTNQPKIVEAILYFAEKIPNIDKGKLLKILYFADKRNLNEVGMPIVGDRYFALPKGPIASCTKNFLDMAEKEVSGMKHPFSIITQMSDGKRRPVIGATRPANLSCFSKKNIESLDWAIEKYGKYSFEELVDITHEEESWKEANSRDPESRSDIMNYALMIEQSNPKRNDIIEHLMEYSSTLKV